MRAAAEKRGPPCAVGKYVLAHAYSDTAVAHAIEAGAGARSSTATSSAEGRRL